MADLIARGMTVSNFNTLYANDFSSGLLTGTSLQCIGEMEFLRIIGNTTAVKDDEEADISFDNVATITNSNNFNITASDGISTNSLSIPYELYKLPNSVCDTIEKIDDVWNLVKRIHKIVIDGTEGWTYRNTYTNTMSFNIDGYLSPQAFTDYTRTDTMALCDKVKPIYLADAEDVERIQLRLSGTGLVFYIKKTRLATQDVTGFTEFLASNNVTLYYQLATPVYTPIETPTLDTYDKITTVTSDATPKVTLDLIGNVLVKEIGTNTAPKFGESVVELTNEGAFHAQSAVNPEWPEWGEARYNYGFNKYITPIYNIVTGILESDTMISVGGGKGRWSHVFPNGGHVFEGWNGDETSRLTMLIGKNASNMAEIFVFSSSTGFGIVKLGSDVDGEGVEFRSTGAKFNGTINIKTKTPASASASGIAGDICWDANYIYMCVATNTWKRAELATW